MSEPTPETTLESRWEEVLEDGETLLWTGKPDTNKRWSQDVLISTALGGFIAAFGAVFVIASVATMDRGWEWDCLVGIVFLVIGLLLAFGSVSRDARVRQRQCYALTNRRAIIASTGWGSDPITSFPITPRTRIEFVDGEKATIWFGRNPHTEGTTRAGFQWIEDGRRVFELMRAVQGLVR